MNRFMNSLFLKQREQFAEEYKDRNRGLQLPEGVSLAENIPYLPDGDPAHFMDVYRPDLPGASSAYPVILNVHGGGLIEGSKEFNRRYCIELCRQGFLVFSIEYPLVPDVTVFRQIDAVSRAMDAVCAMLPHYAWKENALHGDSSAVYMVGDSAGAYLMVYAAAMQHSAELAGAANVTPSRLDVKGLGLISGMFYTRRPDKIGLFMPKALYGDGYRRSAFFPFTNPENPAVAGGLPPCFLVTSRRDMLRQYTLDFAKALERNGVPCRLRDYSGGKKLSHAFSVFDPYLPESGTAIREMCDFLSESKN